MADLENKIRDRAFQILKEQATTGRGGAFWDDVSSGLKQVVPFYAPVAEALGYGKKKKAKKQPKKKIVNVQEIIEIEKIAPQKNKGPGLIDEVGKITRLLPLFGLGEKPKRKPSKRNLLIKKLMKEKHMTLPEASKCIKENKLL